jgi:hypothetical protein
VVICVPTLYDCKFDVVSVTETWFTEIDTAAKIDATLAGYKLLYHPRHGKRWNGDCVARHFLKEKICG